MAFVRGDSQSLTPCSPERRRCRSNRPTQTHFRSRQSYPQCHNSQRPKSRTAITREICSTCGGPNPATRQHINRTLGGHPAQHASRFPGMARGPGRQRKPRTPRSSAKREPQTRGTHCCDSLFIITATRKRFILSHTVSRGENPFDRHLQRRIVNLKPHCYPLLCTRVLTEMLFTHEVLSNTCFGK